MTRRDIIDELVELRPELSYRKAEQVVNVIFDTLCTALAQGNQVEIRGFGSFGVKERRARQGRNPRTGESVYVRRRRVPFFRASRLLREVINRIDADEKDRDLP